MSSDEPLGAVLDELLGRPRGWSDPCWRRRQQPFTRSHHRASLRMRDGTLAGSMRGDPRAERAGYDPSETKGGQKD